MTLGDGAEGLRRRRVGVGGRCEGGEGGEEDDEGECEGVGEEHCIQNGSGL